MPPPQLKPQPAARMVGRMVVTKLVASDRNEHEQKVEGDHNDDNEPLAVAT
jgi:hypothetical protein